MRSVRTAAGADRTASDAHEVVDGDGQSDIALAVLQMEGETIRKIDAALERLQQHTYGNCGQCGCAIGAERLSALPFAARCTRCEQAREQTSAASRRLRASVFDEAAEPR